MPDHLVAHRLVNRLSFAPGKWLPYKPDTRFHDRVARRGAISSGKRLA